MKFDTVLHNLLSAPVIECAATNPTKKEYDAVWLISFYVGDTRIGSWDSYTTPAIGANYEDSTCIAIRHIDHTKKSAIIEIDRVSDLYD